MPLNWLWSGIYDDLIAAISWWGSDNLSEAAYYKITTAFVNDLTQNDYSYNGKTFHTLRMTGVSLGGGIAMITGAQTEAYAVAISGINPVLGRHTFDPPLSQYDIDNKILNVHPASDFKSEIGDLPRLYQEIECRDTGVSPTNCHSFYRGKCKNTNQSDCVPRLSSFCFSSSYVRISLFLWVTATASAMFLRFELGLS